MTQKSRAEFERLAADGVDKLRRTIRRLVGHPDETDDLVQEALLRAWDHFDTFREESAFSTWLCSIGSRLAIDHLRQQKRWRVRAQVAYANECLDDAELAMEIGQAFASPGFSYDVNEHVAYCFACVGRSLNADEYSALVLREVLGLGNREAAAIAGTSESVLRHRLAAGRRAMTEAFDGLCSLVNKQGVCYQCKGLRDVAPGDRKGPPPPSLETLEARLAVVAGSGDDGMSKALHDVCWRRTRAIEATGRGSIEPSGCGEE